MPWNHPNHFVQEPFTFHYTVRWLPSFYRSLSLSLSLNALLANGYCVFVLCLVLLSLFVLLVAKPLSWDLLLHSTSITVIRIGRTHLVE